MNTNTLVFAQSCADEAPVGFIGIDDITLIFGIISLGYEIWKDCHGSANKAVGGIGGSDLVRQAKATINSNVEGDGQQYTRSLLRRSGKGVHRAGVHYGVRLTGDDLNSMTTHMLNSVAKAGDDVLVSCYYEDPQAALACLGPDEDE